MGKFVKVAKKSEIPTDRGLCVEAGGREIALFKINDKVYAIDHICPHAGGPLAEGAVHGEQVMCPWHGWEFNIKNGQCGFNSALKQDVFKVKEDGDDVYVEA